MISSMPAAKMKVRHVVKYDDNGNVSEQHTYNKLDEPVGLITYVYEYF